MASRERITSLGTAAAAFGGLLVMVSLPKPVPVALVDAARDLAVAIPLSIVPVFAALVPANALRPWRIAGRTIELLSFVLAQFFFVAAVYSLFKHVDTTAATNFIEIAAGAYLVVGAVCWFGSVTAKQPSDEGAERKTPN